VVKGEALGPGLEFDLIRRFLERSAAPGPEVLVGPGDDCAVIAAPRVAISVDLSMEGVHFRRDWLMPAEIGYRATAAALSDLAAMAAAPIGVLASLAVPPADLPETAVRIMDGVREAVEGCGGALLGGDLVRSTGPLVLDIVALGSAARPALRSGALPGDEVWVTGELGGAAAAVTAWLGGGEPEPAARLAYARPRPRIHEASWLAEEGLLHALLDISDGIAGDLRHLAAASEVALLVDEQRIPVHPAAARTGDGLGLALTGGEDYELCFAAPAGAVESLVPRFVARFGLALTRIGEVLEGGTPLEDGAVAQSGAVFLRRASGAIERLESSGFDHFKGK
jgi:thiamine-monophosphate kinase